MATHFQRLTPDQQALVREFSPAPGMFKAATKRHACRRLGWSMSKFYAVQTQLIDQGWSLKPTKETVRVRYRGRFVRRPLFRILKTEEEYNQSARMERTYNNSRLRTGQKVQRQGQRDNRTAASVFNEEQRIKNARNILRGQKSPVPIGDSGHDVALKKDGNGDHKLTRDELAREMAHLLKQHPRFR